MGKGGEDEGEEKKDEEGEQEGDEKERGEKEEEGEGESMETGVTEEDKAILDALRSAFLRTNQEMYAYFKKNPP